MPFRIVTLPGDGIGPEIMAAALELLGAVADLDLGENSGSTLELDFEEREFGGASIDAHGTALTEETLAACRAADAVLLAAVGGPKWDSTDPAAPRPEQGLLGLRKGLALYANLRPVRPLPALYGASPLRPERIAGTDLLLVRELTGGIYFGAKTRTSDSATDECSYSRAEIERIARVAFRAAIARAGADGSQATDEAPAEAPAEEPGAAREGPTAGTRAAGERRAKLTSVDKANVLETSRLWREVVSELAAREFPHVELDHLLVDNAAMALVSDPSRFDVIVTENMFGDILSDEAAILTGSIGLLPSASLGEADAPGLFEPVHGSAPDIAGQGIANPLAMFLSAALMLRHGLGLEAQAAAVESAVDRALDAGLRTRDLGGAAATAEATRAVLENL